MNTTELITIIILVIIVIETTVLFLIATRKKLNIYRTGRIFVDSSSLMDGRILGVAQAGFFTDELLIPRSVLREMQLLADGSDSEKRARARFGLDIVNELERTINVDANIYNDELDRTKVDERLIELARFYDAAIITNDLNLNKVATAEGIRVLNVNELALVMRHEHLPGESSKIKITGKGSGRRQGVGHLADGTMVVVDNAEKLVGTECDIIFVRYIQTSAGKMLFARLSDQKPRPTTRRLPSVRRDTRPRR